MGLCNIFTCAHPILTKFGLETEHLFYAVSLFEELRVNSDNVQNVGQGQNLDHLVLPSSEFWGGWLIDYMLHWAEYGGNLFFQVLAFLVLIRSGS